VAYLSREVEYVLNAAFSLRGLTSGALLGSLMLVVFWRKGHPMPVIVGALSSLAVMLVLSRLEWISAGATQKIAWPWYTLIGTAVTLGVAWVVRKVMPERRQLK
jgi:hypothetical protein